MSYARKRVVFDTSALIAACLYPDREPAQIFRRTLLEHDVFARVPNVKELSSLADRGCPSPAIDESVFPNTESAWYWSSTPYVGNSAYAWDVSFNDGAVGNATFGGGSRGDGPRVRLVRVE